MTKAKTFSHSPKLKQPSSTPASPEAVERFLEGSAMVGRADAAPEEAPAAPARPAARAALSSDQDESSVYRTVNVKLNKRRYTNLKLISTMTEKPMQQFLAEAVDEIIERHKHMLPKGTTR
ncbi:hypothetical protein [Burkholderia ubonensis]|uniref:hypothetical protein n=1 Tax=Burkholderia ubonensis TaxID=101571 RepID=UPI000AC0F121|nr:hypothetical protein [Burkholderia ubonensis]